MINSCNRCSIQPLIIFNLDSYNCASKTYCRWLSTDRKPLLEDALNLLINHLENMYKCTLYILSFASIHIDL